MSTQTTRLEELGCELGEVIADRPKYEAYEETKAAVEADDDMQGLAIEFNQLREEFNASQQMGEATQEGLRKVRAAQEKLHSEPVMEEYPLVQTELVGKLEKTNEAISEPFAVDFDDEAGGCCNG